MPYTDSMLDYESRSMSGNATELAVTIIFGNDSWTRHSHQTKNSLIKFNGSHVVSRTGAGKSTITIAWRICVATVGR